MKRRFVVVPLIWVACAGAGWVLGATHPEVNMPLCEESVEAPCYDDFSDTVQYDRSEVPIGADVFEDGSWVAFDGTTGCLEGGLCED